jgi:hypothetical protein
MGAVTVAYIHLDEIDRVEEHASAIMGRIRSKSAALGEDAGSCGFGVEVMKSHWDNEIVFYYQDGGTLHQVRSFELHTDPKAREAFFKALKSFGVKLPKNPFG